MFEDFLDNSLIPVIDHSSFFISPCKDLILNLGVPPELLEEKKLVAKQQLLPAIPLKNVAKTPRPASLRLRSLGGPNKY